MGLPVVLSLATMCCEVYDDNSVAVISLITLLCDGSSSVVLVLLSSLLCVLSVCTYSTVVCVCGCQQIKGRYYYSIFI